MHAALVGVLTLLVTSLLALAQNTGHGAQIGNPTLGISIIVPLDGFQCQIYSIWYELTPNSAGLAAGVDYDNIQLHFTTPDNARTVWMAMTIPSQGSGWINWILIVPKGATFFIAPYGNIMTLGEVVSVQDNGSNSTSCLSIGEVTNNFPAVSFNAQAFAALPTATFSPSTQFNNFFTEYPSGPFSTVVVPEGVLIRTTATSSSPPTLAISTPSSSQTTTTTSASSSSTSAGTKSSTTSTSSSRSSSATPGSASTSTPSAGSTPGGPLATQTSAPSSAPHKSNIAAIAGGVAGGALVIAALLLLLCLRRRRRSSERPPPLGKRRGTSLIQPFSAPAAAAAPPPLREKNARGPAKAAQQSGSGGATTSASRASMPAEIMQALRVVTAFVHAERASEFPDPGPNHSTEAFSAVSASRLLELLTPSPAPALRASMPPPRYEAERDHDAEPESPESGHSQTHFARASR